MVELIPDLKRQLNDLFKFQSVAEEFKVQLTERQLGVVIGRRQQIEYMLEMLDGSEVAMKLVDVER